MNFASEYEKYIDSQMQTDCKPELQGKSLDDSFYNCQECNHTECEYWTEYNLDGVA